MGRAFADVVRGVPATESDSQVRRCLVVAEVAQAHDGSMSLAHAHIDAAATAGADAVKFQTHIAEAESTPGEPWRIRFSPQDATRYDYWKRTSFDEAQWCDLRAHANEVGLLFLSSPFSVEAAALLARVGVAAWKIPSGEVATPGLLEQVAETGRPVLLSTGMSPIHEIDRAVERLREAGVDFAVMQCTSAYPCPPESVGLNVLAEFRQRYHCPVGLSDHSGTIFPAIAAVTLGAEVLELHITLSREMHGPDVVASVTSAEFATMVQGVRFIERMMGSPVHKDVAARQMAPLRTLFTKSVVTTRALDAGELIAATDIAIRKPGTGIAASRFGEVIGRRVARPIPPWQPVTESDLVAVDDDRRVPSASTLPSTSTLSALVGSVQGVRTAPSITETRRRMST